MQTKQIHVDKTDTCRQNRYMQTEQIHVDRTDTCRQNRYMQTKQIHVRKKVDVADYIAMFRTPM